MQVLCKFRHVVEELILRRYQRVVLKVIHQVLLAMLAQEVKLDLS